MSLFGANANRVSYSRLARPGPLGTAGGPSEMPFCGLRWMKETRESPWGVSSGCFTGRLLVACVRGSPSCAWRPLALEVSFARTPFKARTVTEHRGAQSAAFLRQPLCQIFASKKLAFDQGRYCSREGLFIAAFSHDKKQKGFPLHIVLQLCKNNLLQMKATAAYPWYRLLTYYKSTLHRLTGSPKEEPFNKWWS